MSSLEWKSPKEAMIHCWVKHSTAVETQKTISKQLMLSLPPVLYTLSVFWKPTREMQGLSGLKLIFEPKAVHPLLFVQQIGAI